MWHNRGEAGFAPILHLPYGHWGSGLADGDGDGDVDLVVIDLEGEWWDPRETPTLSYSVTLWVNDGEGGFVPGDRLAHNGYQPVLRVGPISWLGGAPVVESPLLAADGSCRSANFRARRCACCGIDPATGRRVLGG